MIWVDLRDFEDDSRFKLNSVNHKQFPNSSPLLGVFTNNDYILLMPMLETCLPQAGFVGENTNKGLRTCMFNYRQTVSACDATKAS